MADTSKPKKPRQQPRGIAAAAIEGAREGQQPDDASPDDSNHAAKLARPQPGMTEQPEPSPSSTGQYTGVTGQIRGQPRDDDDDDDDHDEGEGEDRDRPRER